MKTTLVIYVLFLCSLFIVFLRRKRPSEGENLLHWLSRWPLEDDFLKENEKGQEKKQYKFYTELVDKMLHFNRAYGGNPKKNLLFIKKTLLGDLRFEKKILKEMKGSYFQYAILSLVTWLFIWGSQSLLNFTKTSKVWPFLIILSFQIMGGILFAVMCQFLKKKDFFFFDKFYGVLFSFLCLVRVELPIGAILEKSSLERIYQKAPSEWSPLVKELTLIIERWKTLGGEIKGEVYEIVEETHFIRDLTFETFKEKILFLRLIFLGIFFLGPYLFYLSLLLNSFLIV
jgi:hypothetical protein